MQNILSKFICAFAALLLIVFIASCSKTNSTSSTPSSDATITAMRFAANSSNPHINEASFTILSKYSGDTGLIYNRDSIVFGTRIDSVVPVFTYNATPYSIQFHIATDTLDTFRTFKTGDTINFKLQPMYLTVVAQDRKAIKTYKVEVNVHQADPDLFVWQCYNQQVFSDMATQQKVLKLKDRYCWLASDGSVEHLFCSDDCKNWEPKPVVQGRSVMQYVTSGDRMFYVDTKSVLVSEDMESWTQFGKPLPDNYVFSQPLFYFDNSLWALAVSSDDNNPVKKYKIVMITDDDLEVSDFDVPADFPVEGFAAATLKSTTGRPRAMVIGGYNSEGKMINSRWNIEAERDGRSDYKIINFSDEKAIDFPPIAGAAIVSYNDDIYMFGGLDQNNNLVTAQMRVSEDEGMHWIVPDTAHNKLPATFTARYNATAIVSGGEVFVFGGRSRSSILSDVHRAYINSVRWKQN